VPFVVQEMGNETKISQLVNKANRFILSPTGVAVTVGADNYEEPDSDNKNKPKNK
jgi:hypothetical protein